MFCLALPALSADTIGSLTKTALGKLGVPTNFLGPHSTRGAGVSFYKQLGLTSEEVCEIGKWKIPMLFNPIIYGWGPPKLRVGGCPILCTPSHLVVVQSPTSLGLLRGPPNQEVVNGRAKYKTR